MNLELDFKEAEERILSLARGVKNLVAVAREWGGGVVRHVRGRLLRIGREDKSSAGGPPATRSGGRGLLGRITSNPLDDGVEIGTSESRDELLHFGGTIKAKDKSLTVPLNAQARGKRARDFPDLFLIPPRPGAEPEARGILAMQGSQKGRDVQGRFQNVAGVIPMFALRRSATIKKRPFLSISDEDVDDLEKILERQLSKEAFGG